MYRKLHIILFNSLFVSAVLAGNSMADNSNIPRSRLHLPPPGAYERAPEPRGDRTPPVSEEVVNPAEFCRAEAVIIYWVSSHSQVLIDICLAVAMDDKVICCVSSPSQQSQASYMMNSAGVNMANIDFFLTVDGSVWIRDYGPFCIYDEGTLSISDFTYWGGGVDQIPIYLADEYDLPWFQSPLVHEGGNHITDGNGMGFFSTNLTNRNPSWSLPQIRQEIGNYLGLDSLVIFPTMEGDLTGHCDMFVKLLNDTLFVIGEYDTPGDAVGNDYNYLNQLAADLDGMQNLDGRGFEVIRLPMNPIQMGVNYINRTYTNSLILNDKVLVPIYNTELDAPAMQIYADLMPDHQVIGIDSEDIIEYLGAIHCVTSTLHHVNPLIIFHEALSSAQTGDEPWLSCRLNPRFFDREVDLHIRTQPGSEFETIPTLFSGGIWITQLPALNQDCDYYFTARAYTNAGTMETSLPKGAPLEFFTINVSNTAVNTPLLVSRPLTARPNPCGLQATFSFSLSREASVTLLVYDVTGRRQRSLLADGCLPAGRHELIWDARDDNGKLLPSGIYLVRLETAGKIDLRKIVLLK